MKRFSVWGFRMVALAGVSVLAAGCGAGGSVNGGASTQTQSLPAVPHSPNPASFMKFNASRKTATLTVDADYNNENGGFDFDGYSFGELTFRMPENYHVTVNFTNYGSMPHSVGLVRAGANNPAGPVIPGAAVPQPLAGLQPGGSATFHFETPAGPRHYELACLVPGHIEVGMYVNFDVVKAAQPSVYVGS